MEIKIKSKKENNKFNTIIDDIINAMKFIKWKYFTVICILSTLITFHIYGTSSNIFKSSLILVVLAYTGYILTFFINNHIKHPLTKLSFVLLMISMESYFMSILIRYLCIDYSSLNTIRIFLEKVFLFVFQIGYLLFAIILINRVIIAVLNKIFK